ncbi:hypothetical protein ACFLTU_09545 [Bacteroidota bacterium]
MLKRKNHISGFKIKMFIEDIQEIGKKYNIHPNQISTWKVRFLSGTSSVFNKGSVKDITEKERVEPFKKVVLLQMEVGLKKNVGKIAKEERLQKVEEDHKNRHVIFFLWHGLTYTI